VIVSVNLWADYAGSPKKATAPKSYSMSLILPAKIIVPRRVSPLKNYGPKFAKKEVNCLISSS
jgi:hypothetical protein